MQRICPNRPLKAAIALLALWITSSLVLPVVLAADSQVPFTPEERLWLADHGEIAIGVDGAWPPIDFVDERGQHAGIAGDFLRLIGERLGVRFSFHAGPTFKDMLGTVMSGELKVGSTISAKPDRAEHLYFSDPFFDVHYTIHTRKDTADIGEIGDLIGRTVAVEDGFFLMGKLEENHPGINLMPVKDTLEALQSDLARVHVEVQFYRGVKGHAADREVCWGQADSSATKVPIPVLGLPLSIDDPADFINGLVVLAQRCGRLTTAELPSRENRRETSGARCIIDECRV